MILCLTKNTGVTMFTFSSPEHLLKDLWNSRTQQPIENGALRLACIDEVHQFFMLGCAFRAGLLKDTLFLKKQGSQLYVFI